MEIYLIIIITVALVGINLYWAINTNYPIFRILGIIIVLMAGLLSCYFVLRTENFNSFNGLFYVLIFEAVCLISIAIFSFYLVSRLSFNAEKSEDWKVDTKEHIKRNHKQNADRSGSTQNLSVNYGEGRLSTDNNQTDHKETNVQISSTRIGYDATDNTDNNDIKPKVIKTKSKENKIDRKHMEEEYAIQRPTSLNKNNMKFSTYLSLASVEQKKKAESGKHAVVLNKGKGLHREQMNADTMDSNGQRKIDDPVTAQIQDQVNDMAAPKSQQIANEPNDREDMLQTEGSTDNAIATNMPIHKDIDIDQKQTHDSVGEEEIYDSAEQEQARDSVEAEALMNVSQEAQPKEEQTTLLKEEVRQTADQQMQSKESLAFTPGAQSEQKTEEACEKKKDTLPVVDDKQSAIIAKAAVFVQEARYLLALRLISSLSDDIERRTKRQADLIYLECLVGLKEYAQAQKKLFDILKEKDHFDDNEKIRLKETTTKLKSLDR